MAVRIRNIHWLSEDPSFHRQIRKKKLHFFFFLQKREFFYQKWKNIYKRLPRNCNQHYFRLAALAEKASIRRKGAGNFTSSALFYFLRDCNCEFNRYTAIAAAYAEVICTRYNIFFSLLLQSNRLGNVIFYSKITYFEFWKFFSIIFSLVRRYLPTLHNI